MKVNVILFSDARRATGSKELQLEMPSHSTVKDVLNHLIDNYGEDFKTAVIDEKSDHYKMIFSVNKILCKANHKLFENDTLMIFPATGGG